MHQNLERITSANTSSEKFTSLRVGQIGVGGFGKYRRDAMRETKLFKLVCAYDLNAQALAECEREDGAFAAKSYEQLLEYPEIEAVIISTGAKYHAEQAIAAMRRGLHVFIEKPLCSTVEELAMLYAAQKQFPVVAAVAHKDHDSEAAAVEMRKFILAGEAGQVVSYEITTAHSGGLMIKPGEWRGDPLRNPGGMLFQCGVHAIHELQYHFGRVTEVACLMRYDVHSTATADSAVCLLRHESGVIGTLNAYHVTPYRHTFSVFGTRANLYRVDGSCGDPTELHVQRTLLDGKKEPVVPLPITGISDRCGNLRRFYDAIRNRTQDSSFDEGARAVAVVFAAEEAARTGKTITIA